MSGERAASLPPPPASARPAAPRPPIFRAPDFEARVDVAAHLARLPYDATCKGFFLIDLVERAARVVSSTDLHRAAQIPERRYIAFRDYPMADCILLSVATARALFPRYPLGEGLRRLGQTTFDTILATHIGRALFGALGKDPEMLFLKAPKLLRRFVSFGEISGEQLAPEVYLFQARDYPAFLETYQIGVLEGVLRHCGRRGRMRIALADVANATIELNLR